MLHKCTPMNIGVIPFITDNPPKNKNSNHDDVNDLYINVEIAWHEIFYRSQGEDP